MKKLIFVVALLMGLSSTSQADEINTISQRLCNNNDGCIDIVEMNLRGAYLEGINEKRSVTIGTLINNKVKSLDNFCKDTDDSVLCIEYKQNIILQYIRGLMSR